MFGHKNVIGGLQAFSLLIGLLGLGVTLVGKAIVRFQIQHPPRQPRVVYNPIIARSPEGDLIDGYFIGMLREGTKGYTPQTELGRFLDRDDARRKADELNARRGLTKREINLLIGRWS
jgi:hypothetical protein